MGGRDLLAPSGAALREKVPPFGYLAPLDPFYPQRARMALPRRGHRPLHSQDYRLGAGRAPAQRTGHSSHGASHRLEPQALLGHFSPLSWQPIQQWCLPRGPAPIPTTMHGLSPSPAPSKPRCSRVAFPERTCARTDSLPTSTFTTTRSASTPPTAKNHPPGLRLSIPNINQIRFKNR